jgi:hypothetical protein
MYKQPRSLTYVIALNYYGKNLRILPSVKVQGLMFKV